MRRSTIRFLAVLLTLCWVVAACSPPGPGPIAYGTDACDYCRMTIADRAFGCERVTVKGKVYKFDSIECMAASEIEAAADSADIHSRWVTDINRPDTFLDLRQAIVIATERLKSPMGVGLVAVGNQQAADSLMADQGGRVLRWEEVKHLVAEQWNLEPAR